MKTLKINLAFSTLIAFSIMGLDYVEAQQQRSQNPQQKRQEAPVKKVSSASTQLSSALALARDGAHDRAAVQLYRLSRHPDLTSQRNQIKYILGVSLMELGYYQVASFQFVDVIRNRDPRYTRQAIEKLSSVADTLGDDSLLNYAVNRVRVDDFPEKNKDMVIFRLGEIQMKNRSYDQAVQSFSRIPARSKYYTQAQFNRGLALLEQNRASEAVQVFKAETQRLAKAEATDTNKVAAQIALARAYYQAKDWESAIQAYRQVPRDHEFWHAALFEQSWAYLRAARFRSALSNFQSLHSSFYEDFYLPESLLLRSIVYLYICKYDEMDKVLSLFEKSYGGVRARLGVFLNQNRNAMDYFSELEKAHAVRFNGASRSSLKIPYNVARSLYDKGDVKRSWSYLKQIEAEKVRFDAQPGFARTALAGYGQRILNNRIRNTKVSIGEMVRGHLVSVRAELKDLYEQAGFIRYEMINGQKEILKKRISGKDIAPDQIDNKISRDFFVQNGYEYYPFQGEYWLDEIGNYQYLGKQSCE
jgi:tetratricopeptide (TPR) repeat protein